MPPVSSCAIKREQSMQRPCKWWCSPSVCLPMPYQRSELRRWQSLRLPPMRAGERGSIPLRLWRELSDSELDPCRAFLLPLDNNGMDRSSEISFTSSSSSGRRVQAAAVLNDRSSPAGRSRICDSIFRSSNWSGRHGEVCLLPRRFRKPIRIYQWNSPWIPHHLKNCTFTKVRRGF